MNITPSKQGGVGQATWTRQNLFDPKMIKELAGSKWPLKVKLRLLFKPKYHSFDVSEDGSCLVTYKELDNAVYITKRKYWPPPTSKEPRAK